MSDLLYWLFYLGVLALVAGCIAYLWSTRNRGGADRPKDAAAPRLSRETAIQASSLGGPHRLSDLERIFEQLAAIEAWGMVLELSFGTAEESIQMIVDRNEVEICAPSLEPADTDLFRRAVGEAGFQARTGYTEGQYCADLTGTWPQIASTIRSLCRSIYGAGEDEEVEVRIFN